MELLLQRSVRKMVECRCTGPVDYLSEITVWQGEVQTAS